ncbi:ADP-ribosylglycohydrolase-domain-containing protein [Paraphoma chrysanthemicola]|nr:ADP-ribosylglycohydrolase-domain-containing protein [Paraphoma chrysanthemicola]
MAPRKKKAKVDYLEFLDTHPYVRETVVDKIYGCMVGSALGDTIGLYTEFMTKSESARRHPDRTFQLVWPATELYEDSHRTRFAPCAWTDDTDQALLIVLSYIHNYTHAGISDPTKHANDTLPTDFAARLKIWLDQGLLALSRPPFGIGQLVGSVVKRKDYLEQPANNAIDAWVRSGRHVAPNGSLMRTHPIGIIGIGLSEEKTWKLSVQVGWNTHVDPRCTVSCCILVALIRGLLRGDITNEKDVDACIERSYAWVKKNPKLMNPGDDETLSDADIEHHLERSVFEHHVYAKTLEDLKLDDGKSIGYVYKCLGSAILLLRLAMRKGSMLSATGGPLALATAFEELTVDLIMEGGDADTNGAAACALVGAYLGYANLPSHWTLGLAHKEWLMSKTYRLAVASGVIVDTLQPEDDEAAEGPRGLMRKEEVDLRDKALVHDMIAKVKARQARERAEEEGKKKKKSLVGWLSG